MHLSGFVHANINCTNYEQSLQFYEMLGFREFWQVPETNTPEVAAAVGMPPYKVKGALLELPNSQPRVVIDLLEWKDPVDHRAPYDNLYRPGIARLALATTNLKADYEYLLEQGVEVIAPPATVMSGDKHGSSFFCFKDPDGTYLELVESF